MDGSPCLLRQDLLCLHPYFFVANLFAENDLVCGRSHHGFGSSVMLFTSRKPRLLLMLAILAAASGCSKSVPVAEVNGVIKMDGKPMPYIKIMFMPDSVKKTLGPISSGLSDDQGRFKLTCEDGRQGAVIGWHKVVVFEGPPNFNRAPRKGRRDDDEVVKKVTKPKAKGPPVPYRYTSSGTTPLSQEVKENKNDLEILLTH